jgi:hypothetical protein
MSTTTNEISSGGTTKADDPYPYAEGEPGSDERILSVAIERFKQCLDASDKIRAEALEDVLFINGQQWLESIIKDRADDRRPAMTVNRLPAFVNQIVNDMRKNRPAIKIRPTADQYKDNASVVDGLVRSIMTNGDAKTALDTASLYQVVNGFGYIRVLTDYCNDESFDQIIKIDRCENPFAVYFPIHLCRQLDYSDAPFCFIRSKMSKEEFYRKYPNVKTDNYELQGTGDPNWISKDYIYVAEYFDVIYDTKKLYLLRDGTTTKEKPKNPKDVVRTRDIETHEIKWYLLTQYDILERRDWVGKYIPVIPVLGQEINENGVKTYISMIRFAKDPQRMFNYMYSSFAESVALAPRAPWVAAEGQIEDFKSDWQTANQKNHAVLVYKPTSLDGQTVPPPQRTQPADAGASVLQGMSMAVDNLKAVTGVFDASLGAPGNETSGRAIIARQKEGDNSNYHFMANMQIATHHLGRILVDMIPKIYDTARTVRILGEDMTDKIVELNQESEDQDEIYDMSVGEYEILVDVGPTYETKRVETAQNLINIITALPQVGTITADILMRQLDFPLSDEAADRLKRMIQNTNPGVIVDTTNPGGKMTPSQIQEMVGDMQKLMQAHQQTMQENMQMQQIIQGMEAQLKDKSMDRDVELQKTIIKAQTELDRADMNNQHDFLTQAVQHGVDLHKMNQNLQRHTQPAPVNLNLQPVRQVLPQQTQPGFIGGTQANQNPMGQ